MNIRSLLLVTTTLLFLAGCASVPPPIPPELQYGPPPSGQPTAVITGSQTPGSWGMDDFTAYVSGVNGKRVMIGRKGWNTPLVIPAEKCLLVAEFQRGVFHTQIELALDAVAGASYELQFSSDVGFNGNNTYCDFWIVDRSTGKAVTAIKRGTIGGGSGGTYVPIFIPVR